MLPASGTSAWSCAGASGSIAATSDIDKPLSRMYLWPAQVTGRADGPGRLARPPRFGPGSSAPHGCDPISVAVYFIYQERWAHRTVEPKKSGARRVWRRNSGRALTSDGRSALRASHPSHCPDGRSPPGSAGPGVVVPWLCCDWSTEGIMIDTIRLESINCISPSNQ